MRCQAVVLLGARSNRYRKDGGMSAHPPSSIPSLALGAWVLTVGWFGFNVMSAQTLDKISGLVAVNSLLAMVGGTLAALVFGKNDPGFVHNGPLAGLVAVCAGSDLMHPLGALVVGAVAGGIFVRMFTCEPKTSGKSTMCWASGRCTACAAPRSAWRPAFLAARRWVAWAASHWARSSSEPPWASYGPSLAAC